MYIVNYGIALYFKQHLDSNLEKASLCTLSFQDSLNKITNYPKV